VFCRWSGNLVFGAICEAKIHQRTNAITHLGSMIPSAKQKSGPVLSIGPPSL
jgi:hypothetical protein